MSDKSTDGEAPEPVEPTVEQPAVEQRAPVAYAPPVYGSPTAAPVAASAPRKKLSERVFGWKSVVAATAVGLVLGGGVAAGVVAAVLDGGSDQGRRELGQMPDFGQGDRGPGDFGRQQDQS